MRTRVPARGRLSSKPLELEAEERLGDRQKLIPSSAAICRATTRPAEHQLARAMR
jgi:hypothetical protein